MPGKKDGFGRHLRNWRGRRPLSQLELSLRYPTDRETDARVRFRD